MRKLLNVAILVALAVGILYLSAVGTTQTTTAQQLSQIQHQLAKAAVEADLETFNRILASDWTSIDLAGRVLTKPQVLEELASKEREVEAASIDDIRVREFGEVAVVTGRTTATGSYQGQRSTVVLRFTDVFVKREGRWQAVASQGTLIKK